MLEDSWPQLATFLEQGASPEKEWRWKVQLRAGVTGGASSEVPSAAAPGCGLTASTQVTRFGS